MIAKLSKSKTFLLFLLFLIFELAISVQIAKPNCSDSCGNIKIPYPFGMGAKECYLNDSFEILCYNETKPFIKIINLEVFNISLDDGQVQVRSPIFFHNCPVEEYRNVVVNLSGSSFYFSSSNIFTAVGCNTTALMTDTTPQIFGCKSTCRNDADYCLTTIPSNRQILNVTFSSVDADKGHEQCNLACLVDQKWLATKVKKKKTIKDSLVKSGRNIQPRHDVSFLLDWKVFDDGVFKDDVTKNCYKIYPYSYYSDTTFPNTTLCQCNDGYEGNPYITNGCIDINECEDQKKYSVSCPKMTKCVNVPGSHKCKINSSWIIIIVIGSVIVALLTLLGIWRVYKFLKKRQNIKLKQKFFKRNGGLLLQQQLNASDGSVLKTKVFSSRELETATDGFNENRVLGQGGQGTVYKGMLTDGSIVAVKKSKIVDEEKLEEFINEVVILSQISHRNVVKLLGCCLETDVPLLVYEFIPNGNLFQYLHDQKEQFPLSWEMRLRIAAEVSGALCYLHFASSIPIYHRDIKSTNILLDEKHRAKVSDFGTSRTITVEQTHLTTIVQGTFGYLDPEYFLSGHFTDKSDVYSFGVVLVELLTGKKPISLESPQESKVLTAHFILMMEKNRLFDIIDAQVIEHCHDEEVIAVANLAKRCLSLNGKERPTMKEVAVELERIRLSRKNLNEQQNNQETENFMPEVLTNIYIRDALPSSNSHGFDNKKALSLDVERLIFYSTL